MNTIILASASPRRAVFQKFSSEIVLEADTVVAYGDYENVVGLPGKHVEETLKDF